MSSVGLSRSSTDCAATLRSVRREGITHVWVKFRTACVRAGEYKQVRGRSAWSFRQYGTWKKSIFSVSCRGRPSPFKGSSHWPCLGSHISVEMRVWGWQQVRDGIIIPSIHLLKEDKTKIKQCVKQNGNEMMIWTSSAQRTTQLSCSAAQLFSLV